LNKIEGMTRQISQIPKKYAKVHIEVMNMEYTQ